MAITNYSDLKAEIGVFLSRGGMDARISSAISLFESRYNASEDNYFAERVATLSTSAGSALVTLPTDFNSHVEMSIPAIGGIGIVTLGVLNQNAVYQGVPKEAAFYPENRLKLSPTPSAIYNIELVYEAKVSPLSDTAPTNWMLQQYPYLYMYGALMFLLDAIQDNERANIVKRDYAQFLIEIQSKKPIKKLGNTPVMQSKRGMP